MTTLREAVEIALAEYDREVDRRGPRGGKPTVAQIAGEGQHLAMQLRKALADDRPERWWGDKEVDIGYGVCPDCGFAYASPYSRPCGESGGPL